MRLTGQLPKDWDAIPYLIEFRANNNAFCGPILDWFVNNKPLRTLSLAENNWSCEIPNYCDEEKLLCDYEADAPCKSTYPLPQKIFLSFVVTNRENFISEKKKGNENNCVLHGRFSYFNKVQYP